MFERLFPQLAKAKVTPDMVVFQLRIHRSETQVIARNYGCSCFVKHDPAARDKKHPHPDEVKRWVDDQIKANEQRQRAIQKKRKADRIAKSAKIREEVNSRIAGEKSKPVAKG